MLKSTKQFLIIALLLVGLCGCYEDIIHNLSELEANRLLTKLQEVSIDAAKIKQPDGRWSLRVDKPQAMRAITYLNETHTLRDDTSLADNKSSLVSSREDQRFRFERALSREIESTLRNLAGVLEARVHLNLPVTDPLFGRPLDNQPGSASVLLMVEKMLLVTKEEVARLVAGASGIQNERITVVVNINVSNGRNDSDKSNAVIAQTANLAQPQVGYTSDLLTYISKHRTVFSQLAICLIIAGVATVFLVVRNMRRNSYYIRGL